MEQPKPGARGKKHRIDTEVTLATEAQKILESKLNIGSQNLVILYVQLCKNITGLIFVLLHCIKGV